MARSQTASSVAVTMHDTETTSNVAARGRVRPAERVRPRREPLLPDTTHPALRNPAPLRDDGSHTAPHGDAVVPRRKPAR
jgi:hypothetical protein